MRASAGPALPAAPGHPALRTVRAFHGTEEDGQRYAVDRNADHATLADGTLRVKVYWTGCPAPTWLDATDAPQETLRVYLRRVARERLPHTSADPPPGVARGPAAIAVRA